MLVRARLLFSRLVCLAGASLAMSTVACSSLTRPDEIQIYAEPPPAPRPAAQPAMPAGPAGAPQARPAGGGSGG